MPAQGIAIHIGLNYVDPDHYGGWNGKLTACEFDACDMERIATSQGFTTTKLLHEKATRAAVLGALAEAAARLRSEDILLITYSGHGGQIPDLTSDEPDALDETWCLYDAQLADDELNGYLATLPAGVRVLGISDSCHSQSVFRAPGSERQYTDASPKFMPDEVARRTYMANRDFYDSLFTPRGEEPINATVRLISGCQDNQSSYDGPFNGAFTAALKKVWADGRFVGDYDKFHRSIQRLLPAYQSPAHSIYGRASAAYDKQKPFTVSEERNMMRVEARARARARKRRDKDQNAA